MFETLPVSGVLTEDLQAQRECTGLLIVFSFSLAQLESSCSRISHYLVINFHMSLRCGCQVEMITPMPALNHDVGHMQS
jgi:hypothetical protein